MFTTLIDIFAELVGSILRLLGELFGMVSDRNGWGKKGYQATFTDASSILKTYEKGFCIGGKRALSVKTSFQHLLVSAGSGLGKSTTVGIPSLFRLCGQGSVVCLDPSKELYQATAAYYSKGYRIVTIDLSDKEGWYSDGWNPFPENPADLPKVIDTLTKLELGSESRDPFWQLQAASLLTTLGMSLYQRPKAERHFASLTHLLNQLAGRPDSIDRYLSEHLDDANWTEYLAFQQNAANVKASIIASAKTVLRLWSRPNICRISSHNSADIGNIRKHKTIVYLQTNAAELVQYSSLIALFFEELLSKVLADLPTPEEENLFLLLDEAGIYRVGVLPLAITQARKMRCGIALLVQSEQQIFNLYGKELGSTILSNSYTKVYLTNQPLATARELEALGGKIQYKDDKEILRDRPLMTADEIRSMSPNSALVLHGHYRPSVVQLKPYYKNRKLRLLSRQAAPPIYAKLPPDHNIALPPLTDSKPHDDHENQ